MKQAMKLFLSLLAIAVFASAHAASEEDWDTLLPISKVTTAAQQSKMSPKQAFDRLKAGNQRFLSDTMIQRNYLKQAKQSSYGQYPWAVVLNCMDSRSVPEFIFDQGVADLFTLRVAGNVLNEDILGSLEFATKAAGARLIVVLGHTGCGAVKGACEDVQLGQLNHVLDKIKPAVSSTKKKTGLKDCNKPKLVDEIAKQNVLRVANEIPERSEIIKKLLEQGEIGIVAGMHNIRTGQVTFFEEAKLANAPEVSQGAKK